MRLPKPSSAGGSRRTFLQVEALEERAVPACTVTQMGNSFVIDGDNGPNELAIVDNGTNAPGNIQVFCDGTVTVAAAFVNELHVDMGAGNDLVFYIVPAGMQPEVDRAVTVHLGAGNDQFIGLLSGTIREHVVLVIWVMGEDGEDGIYVYSDSNVEWDTTVLLDLSGGNNNDIIDVIWAGDIDGELIVFLAGENGADEVGYDILFRRGSMGSLIAYAAGNDGDDWLHGFVRKEDPDDMVDINAAVDGGAGDDMCMRTANVSGIDCEMDQVVP